MNAVPEPLLREIFGVVAEVFQVEISRMTEATVSADIEGWDSVTDTILMLELERRFDLDLPLEVTRELLDLGALARLICERRATQQ